MLSRLVVPLDGSELGERALPYAIQLARANKGQLMLVRAALGPPPSGLDWEAQQLAAVNEAETYLARLAEQVKSLVLVETVVPYGAAAPAIIETVRSFKADGVVMATHARTGPAHLVHGSVAEAVLETANVPVFLVQAVPGQAAATPFDPRAARILVPLDGSPFGAVALSTAMDVLGPNGELVLVRVVAPAAHAVKDERDHVIAYIDQVQDRLNAEASEYLRSVARRVNQERPEARVRIDVRVGKPVDGIAAAAADHVTDLIIMATHGRTGLRRAVLGSVAGAVLRTSRIPVLMVRPSEPPRQAEETADSMDVSAFVSF